MCSRPHLDRRHRSAARLPLAPQSSRRPRTSRRQSSPVASLGDRSFRRTGESFRTENDDGYLVDLIKPVPSPPWRIARTAIGKKGDLEAAEIHRLVWLENAPLFDQVAIDEKGYPFRIASFDPRVFAIHKLWVSSRDDRDPLKKAPDGQQAKLVAELTRKFLPNLPFDASELRMLPKDLVEAALLSFGPQ
ncbi:MAG: GSU2403 family nucleotidyltransferase fold protein [Hyphomicrobiales bacterium]|nr:GSU2403 family nucleotidyltransferase fold protein [Hyphomicrobiales bacterium]